MSQYVPTITRDQPLLGVSEYRGTIHAWYEALDREGRPFGSRALCGKRSRAWCVHFDGFHYYGPADIETAESVSYFGSMCPDCRQRLDQRESGTP